MNFLTSYYWKEGEPSVSLTLQQVTRKRGKVPIVLACVCEEREAAEEQGERYCVRLTDWFYERVLERCRQGRAVDLTILGEEVVRMAKDTAFTAAGFLCVEERFLLFYRGEQKICLLNSRFLRANLKELSVNTPAEGALVMEEGILQSRLGLLFGSKSFYLGITEEEIRNCLAADAIRNEMQVGKRLGELGCLGERRERGKGAAILVMTR